MNTMMNNRTVHNDDKPFPGCLGRMVNLFDLTTATSVNGNKLLTDKPHRDHGFLFFSSLIYITTLFFIFPFLATKFIALPFTCLSFHSLWKFSMMGCGFLLLGFGRH